jgi:hypothetical protein
MKGSIKTAQTLIGGELKKLWRWIALKF